MHKKKHHEEHEHKEMHHKKKEHHKSHSGTAIKAKVATAAHHSKKK